MTKQVGDAGLTDPDTTGPGPTGTQWVSGFSGNGNFSLNMNSLKVPGTTYNISSASLLGTTDIQLNPVLTCNPTSGLGHNQYINPSCFSPATQIGQNGPTELPAIYGPAWGYRRRARMTNW
jgi:hypothetical protein